MQRNITLKELEVPGKVWDFAVIGGGATGLGIAVDAASRGYSVVLFEQSDFTKATSSRSTKLVHGGVRYLAQGDVGLVLEALKERGLLRRNAPHLVKDQSFIIPCYKWWEAPFYTIGLTLYDVLAGRLGLGRSLYKKKSTTEKLMPTLKRRHLRGGVLYHDGQFDDSRLAVNLAESAFENGGFVLNYAKVTSLLKDNGKVSGVRVTDTCTGKEYEVQAKAVVNATGVFVDSVIQMDNPEEHPMVRPSQGVHLVLDKSFLQSDCAIMIPKTDDGRVLFAVPWHDKVVVGTTDTVREKPELEPRALEQEIAFILNTAGRYLTKMPGREDVLSVFAGLRPLAAPRGEGQSTKEISRRHKIIVSPSGLITITGGKWTTYRRMAQDTVNEAIKRELVSDKECVTEHLKIHGYTKNTDFSDPLYFYGSDASAIRELMNSDERMGRKLHPDYDYTCAEVVWAVRQEMALSVEDVLARRLRMLFLDARAAIEMASFVAEIMAEELHRDKEWEKSQVDSFTSLAKSYLLTDTMVTR